MSKNPSLSKALLASPLGQEIVHCVGECASNVLNGNTNLSQLQKRKLGIYKNGLRAIANQKTSLPRKKKIIQKGGFIGALLGPLIGSVLLPLAKKIFT
jgi:hypothetical protein